MAVSLPVTNKGMKSKKWPPNQDLSTSVALKALSKKVKQKDSGIAWTDVSTLIHQGLSALYREDVCTDFEIAVGPKIFRCHKVVLASVSDYFRGMFNSGMKETEENKATFDNFSPEAFETLFSILYPDVNNVNPLQNKSEEQMTELYNMASFMQMDFLQKVCKEYFQNTMSVKNCVERWKTGQNMLCDDVTELAWDFIADNFGQLVHEETLLSLDFPDFHALLKDESIFVGSEDTVWELIKRWITADPEARKVHFVSLIKECCLTEVEREYLSEEIVFDPLVRLNDEASRLVQQALKYKNHPGIHGNIDLKFRSCYMKDQSLVLFLKNDGTSEAGKSITGNDVSVNLSAWSRRQQEWNEWPTLKKAGDYFTCSVHGGSVFVTGGCYRDSLFELNGSTMKWTSLREMSFPLNGHTMSATNGCLYVLGGRSSHQENTRVLQYIIGNGGDTWRIEGDILAPVMNASSVAINNKIYLFGGEINEMPADCVQMYDTRTKTATILCNLPKPTRWSRALCRGTAAYLVTIDGDIVKVQTENEHTSKVVATIPNFNRTHFGIDLRGNEMYVFGGRQSIPSLVPKETNIDEALETLDLAEDKVGTVEWKTCDDVFVVDIETGKVEEGAPLPRPWEVLGCANLVHNTEL